MTSKAFARIQAMMTIVGLCAATIVLGLAILPWYWIVYAVIQHSSHMPLILRIVATPIAIASGYAVFGLWLVVLVVLLKNLLNLTGEEGAHPIRSWKIMRFAAFHGFAALATYCFIPFVTCTPIIVWYFRGLGARIGKNTLINTPLISDCDLVEIGDNCDIGGHVVINGHSAENGMLIRERVRIGNNVTLGQYSTILPGVVIEDGVIVGANSLVPKNRRLKQNCIYIGVPARLVGHKNQPFLEKNLEIPLPPVQQIRQPVKLVVDSGELAKLNMVMYSNCHSEIRQIEAFMAQLSTASLGLITTVALYSIVNKSTAIAAMLPVLVGLSQLILMSLNVAMLKVAFKMAEIEARFRVAGAVGFDWETRYGILGRMRLTDHDAILFSGIYLAVFVGGIYFTYTGQLISPSDIFLGHSTRSIFLGIDLVVLAWLTYSVFYLFWKRHSLRNTVARLENRMIIEQNSSRPL